MFVWNVFADVNFGLLVHVDTVHHVLEITARPVAVPGNKTVAWLVDGRMWLRRVWLLLVLLLLYWLVAMKIITRSF